MVLKTKNYDSYAGLDVKGKIVLSLCWGTEIGWKIPGQRNR